MGVENAWLWAGNIKSTKLARFEGNERTWHLSRKPVIKSRSIAQDRTDTIMTVRWWCPARTTDSNVSYSGIQSWFVNCYKWRGFFSCTPQKQLEGDLVLPLLFWHAWSLALSTSCNTKHEHLYVQGWLQTSTFPGDTSCFLTRSSHRLRLPSRHPTHPCTTRERTIRHPIPKRDLPLKEKPFKGEMNSSETLLSEDASPPGIISCRVTLQV